MKSKDEYMMLEIKSNDGMKFDRIIYFVSF